MPINLGKAAQDLRKRLQLSLRDAADELEMSYVHLCNVENGKASLSPETIEKFHDAWGIDLYMFALAFHSEDRKTPKALQVPLTALKKIWSKHIESMIDERAKEKAACLTSVD